MRVKDILMQFNTGQCQERYQQNGICYSYFLEKFNEYPSVLSIEKKDYIDHIKSFHDPILIYVALYLYDNYSKAKNFFNEISKTGLNVACYVLNRWLDQQKNFYTDFGKCSYNRRWWNIYIEPLWKRLEEYYPEKTCKSFNSYYDPSMIPYDLDKQDISYQQISENNICYKEDDEKSLEENCTKLSILFYLGEKYKLLGEYTEATKTNANNYCPKDTNKAENIYHDSMLKAEKLCFCESFISAISFPICVTVLVTIFLAFFLNEFTPLGSKLRTRSKNKVRFGEHFNEEVAYEEYKTYRNNNKNRDRKKNIIYYQSLDK